MRFSKEDRLAVKPERRKYKSPRQGSSRPSPRHTLTYYVNLMAATGAPAGRANDLTQDFPGTFALARNPHRSLVAIRQGSWFSSEGPTGRNRIN